MEIQRTAEIVLCAVGNEELDAGSCISFYLVFQPIDAGLRTADALLINGRCLDGVIERKGSGVFHQFIEIVFTGYPHITEVDTGIELGEMNVHPTGLRISGPIGLDGCINRNPGGEGAFRIKRLIGLIRKIDAEISAGFGRVVLRASRESDGKEANGA